MAGPARPLPPNTWAKLTDGQTGKRTGAMLLFAPDLKKMLLFGGNVEGVAYMQALTPGEATWRAAFAGRPQVRRGIHPYYQAAYDAHAKRIYCLHEGALFTLDLRAGEWKSHGPPAALAGLSWHAMAIDPDARKIVVLGSDKKVGNIGWTRTAILDLGSGQWSTLPLPAGPIVKEHRALVAAREALIDLIGRIRLGWYRDPKSVGTDAERGHLAERCQAVRKMPGMGPFSGPIEKVAGLIAARKMLAALHAARTLQRKVEELSEAQYPVPCSRRNSPLVFDARNKVFVLFGGDHEDYQMNDTWVLDLAKRSWRRATCDPAPAPRAGHALVYLPRSGRIAMFGGYVASSNGDYRSRPWTSIGSFTIWLYDVAEDTWQVLLPGRARVTRAALPATPFTPRAAGRFYGYSAQWYSPPATAADESDRILLVVQGDAKVPSSTWRMEVDATRVHPSHLKEVAKPPNQRFYRHSRFRAAHCEVPHPDRRIGVRTRKSNRWVKLPQPERNVAYGCRQRDWGTSVWDSDNDQILLWGGGHCVRSASTVLHYSPASGQMVEGYDADEPYGYNGGGGFGSSVWNRPWVPTHGYNLYAYDPKCKLLVTATGFLYDPVRMDWLRMEPMKRPFRFHWAHTVIETTPHGAVAWGQAADSERIGLWLFDRQKGWGDLKPKGKLYRPYCDSDGIVHDAKRDRLILGWGGGYNRKGDGSITTFDFETRKVEKITPANTDLGKLRNTREMVYVDHADSVLFGSTPYVQGDPKTGKRYSVVYDCAKNAYLLLDAGEVPYGHSTGWMYDAKRKRVYVFTYRGEAHVLNLEPKTATLLERPPK